MCSIGEDDFGDIGGIHSMPEDVPLVENEKISGMCQKCKNSEAIVKLKFREPECRECFLIYVRHKFRATLGSSKILPKNASVLLVFDGSPESIVLLDMLYFAQTQNTFKRLHCNANVLYIDDSCLLEKDIGKSQEYFNEIEQFLSNYKLNSYVISICGKEKPVTFKDYLTKNNSGRKEHENSFCKLVLSIESLTSRQDFIEKYRKNLITISAENLGNQFVFLPDISSNLASALLTNISLGRGGSTALDVSLCDDRTPNLKLIRPLKDLSDNEIHQYLKLNQIMPINKLPYGRNWGENSNIQNLTFNFISNLQKGFSSTVSTVFRTGDKIAPNSLFNEKLNLIENRCTFCNSNLDYFNSKTLLAIEFSRLVSENTSKSNLDNTEILEKNALKNLCGDSSKSIASLCHACRNIYEDCKDLNAKLLLQK